MTIFDCIEKLKDNIERAEGDNWCVLNLNATEGEQWLAALEAAVRFATCHQQPQVEMRFS